MIGIEVLDDPSDLTVHHVRNLLILVVPVVGIESLQESPGCSYVDVYERTGAQDPSVLAVGFVSIEEDSRSQLVGVR